MIRIPRIDIERCDAFSVPHLDGIDTFNLFKAQEDMEYGALRMSSFAKKKIFSFEKLTAYINSFGGNVFLQSNEFEQVYCISACDLNELQGVLYGGEYPTFLQNYDFDNDVYVRS